MRRQRIRLASFAVVVAAAASVVAYALSAEGYAVHHASLNDGGIWVTKGKTGQFGRLNKPINQLDGAVYSVSVQAPFDVDVFQDGAAVVAKDAGKGQLYPLDVAGLKASENSAVNLPSGAAVAMDGGVLAVLDPSNGAVRGITFDPEQPLSAIAGVAKGKPLATVGAGAALAVGTNGTIYAASTSAGIVTIPRADGGFGKPHARSLRGVSGALAITAVGDQPVVLATPNDASGAAAVLPGGRTISVPSGAGGVLQEPGPAASDVLLATPTGLISVPLAGSRARTLFAHGTGQRPAAPVRLAGCIYAAWPGAYGVYGSSCAHDDSLTTAAIPQPSTSLRFRVNRDQLLLNDVDSGNTWNVDSGKPQQVANWTQISPPRKQNDKKTRKTHANTDQARALPPKPAPDSLGARPGRTTPLFVLDNDSDPSGETLAVDSVSATGAAANWLSVSPDGQTIDIALPPGTTGDTTFKYVVSAARGGTAQASVVVHPRPLPEDARPTLRKGYKSRVWQVPESGTVTIPVLADWRDYTDGDPIVLTGARPSAGQVATTPDGSLIFTAPAQSGSQTIRYTVGDGAGQGNSATVQVQVVPPTAAAAAAQAEPDYARGQVGRPITVAPLANDLPGSDPLHPTATLQMAGTVSSPAGTTVQTDSASGAVTVTAKHPGTFMLGYQVAYGSAPLAHSTIRVDVDAAGAARPPITAPDDAVLHGQQPVTVDVLANDADPAGYLLAVERAAAGDPSQLRVAVIGGQFVRIEALVPHLSPLTQTVNYTVSDGVTGDVSGEITVTQLPAPADDTPITLADFATVRAGDSVAIPVLDNDATPAGDPLALVKDVSTAPAPGQYTVAPAFGAAYVSGNVVRYVAPATVRQATSVTIDYYAQNAAATQQQVGHAQVTITPPVSKTNPDQPPTPRSIDVRTVAGDTVTIKVPTSGVDPDGDSIVVTGVGSAPTLGRVLGFTAGSITYQAYPAAGNGGTDTFRYTVSDTYNMAATGTIRVAVVPPGDPQPPVAVDDALTVGPNAAVRVDPLANDLVAPDDRITITPLAQTNPDATAGERLLSPNGPIDLKAGGDAKHPVTVVYQITDGLARSRATITVRSQPGINLPPVAVDQYPQPKGTGTSLRVNLLHGDYDPDGAASPVVVAPAGAAAGVVTIRLAGRPQAIPYVIKDAHGAMASAVVYVPAIGTGVPYAKPGAQINVPINGTKTVDIAGYVVDPARKSVRTTTSDTISASPAAGLTATSGRDATHLLLRAVKGYEGPASVTFQVTDGRTLTERGASQAYVTVPVQVGSATPVLRCPAGMFDVVAGGSATDIPVATVCHVWTANPAEAARIGYRATWKRQLSGVRLSGSRTPTLRVQAGGSAHPGATGMISVSVAGSHAPAQALAIRVVKARKLLITPIVINGVKAGESKTVDIRGYVDSPFVGAPIAVVGRPAHASGMPAGITASGSRVTVTPGRDSHGTITFSFVATDVADRTRADRQVPGLITVNVLGRPAQPTGLAASRTVKSNEVDLTWTAPDSNGAPIDHYVVTYNGGSQRCGAAPACAVHRLRNGRLYTFRVVAYNAVGASPASAPTSATPDAVPDQVKNLVASNPQDHTLTLKWTPDVNGNYSTVLRYTLSWQGGSKTVTGASSSTTTVTGLDNDAQYTFSITAWNKKGPSIPTQSTGLRQSAGRAATPGKPTVTVTDDTATNNRVVSMSWAAVDSNGPAPVRYTVVRKSPSGTTELCADTRDPTCRDTNVTLDGKTYTYAVRARNSATTDIAAHTSPLGPETTVEAAATPDPIIISSLTPTGNNGEAAIKFDAPPSHGTSSTVTCTMNPGGSCGSWQFPTAGQSGVSETLHGFTNGVATSVTLQECNGSSGTNFSGTSCVSSSPASVTTYGPIGNPSISASASGTTVSWSISVDPNGRAATVHVATNYGYDQTYTTGVGQWSTTGSQDVGYSKSVTVSVTVSDSGRASTSGSASATTPPPPPPPTSISASQGDLGTGSIGSCTSLSQDCHWLNFQVHNFQTGTFSWECISNGSVSFNSATYGYTIKITNPNQSFTGSSAHGYCIWGAGYSEAIRINGFTSNAVPHS